MMPAAPGKLLVDFGLRRAHGSEAGLMAARASYITGFAGTATVLPGSGSGSPFGTMAHSFIQTYDDETAAFEDCAVAAGEPHPPDRQLRHRGGGAEGRFPCAAACGPRDHDPQRAPGQRRSHRAVEAVRRILDAGGLTGVGIFERRAR